MQRVWYKIWRCLAANLLYLLADNDTKRKIDADVRRYLAYDKLQIKSDMKLLRLDALLLSKDRTFRSVFYYRCKKQKLLCALSKMFLPCVREIEIYGDIEEGLLIKHNYMVVHTNKAGKNLCVEAGVVIGVNNGQFPTLGDNVYIGANSTIIGGINIGSDVTVEPGSVITKDLEGGAVYGGNPAVFIRKSDACIKE